MNRKSPQQIADEVRKEFRQKKIKRILIYIVSAMCFLSVLLSFLPETP